MYKTDSLDENDLVNYIKSKNASTPIKAYLKGDIDVNTDIPDNIDYLELKDGVILLVIIVIFRSLLGIKKSSLSKLNAKGQIQN